MHLRDLDLHSRDADRRAEFGLVDRTGKCWPSAGSSTIVGLRSQAERDSRQSRIGRADRRAAPQSLPKLGQAEVAIIDELDKVQPVTGEMIPKRPESYLTHNHLWDAKSRTIRLYRRAQ